MREAKGLTQAALGAAVGVTSTTISRYETGSSPPGRDELRAVAGVFGYSGDDLLLDELPPPDPARQRLASVRYKRLGPAIPGVDEKALQRHLDEATAEFLRTHTPEEAARRAPIKKAIERPGMVEARKRKK